MVDLLLIFIGFSKLFSTLSFFMERSAAKGVDVLEIFSF